ncbi:MAG TPA: biotin/lipoyl-binding protein [Thermoguttaceae bacterium]|nr:biotin/lipoyl-binding protein [Thermoguttaceae bacterium]
MATLSESLVSSSARRLTVRKRPDLTARKQSYLGRSYWVVKEPVGLNYFRFQEEEYAILQHIDGKTSLDELKDWFEAEFPPQKITLEELQQFVGMLHRSGLVIADVPGQGTQLHERRAERRRKELLAAASNILCIRFKGFDPERFLNWFYPKVRWMFSWTVFVLSLLFVATAMTLVLVEFDRFRGALPGFYQFFSPTNALWLAVTLGLTKVVHEFGHALTCKHFGGECHEMGVMILVLTPCLYCNVSDSWMLPNKWQRAAIGAAGMYVEVVLASAATFLWWSSMDASNLLSMICLNVIFISSVTTIMFNANPLLRYDGYYILSDLTEIPNLRQKATTILSRKMADWFLGIEPQEDPFLPQRNQIFFCVYSVAAAIYRWVVVFSILWFLNQIFKPYRLEIIGHAILAMSLVGLIGMPLYKLVKFFYVPGRMQKVKKPRMYATLAGLVLIGLFISLVPLPYSVMCTLEVRARDADRIYVDAPGTLEEINVEVGQLVKPGQQLGRLRNVDLDLKVVESSGKLKQYDAQLVSLHRTSYANPDASSEIPAIEKARRAVINQLEEQRADQEHLVLRAPDAAPGADPNKPIGVVMPPPWREKRPGVEGQLPSWWGTPLEPRNLGAPLADGDVFCQIGDPAKMEAILYIDQGDVEFVAKGQSVDIKLESLPFDTIEDGRIARIAGSESKVVSSRLSTTGGGEVPVAADETGTPRPQNAMYQASVPLDNSEGLMRIGLRGQAKIHVVKQTIAQRAWRMINQVLSFKL